MEFKIVTPTYQNTASALVDIKYKDLKNHAFEREKNFMNNLDDTEALKLLNKSNTRSNSTNKMVNKIEATYGNLNIYPNYIYDDRFNPSNGNSILIKKIDKGHKYTLDYDLDNKNFKENNILIKDTLGDLEVPLVIPIKDLSTYDAGKKYISSVNGYKNSDINKNKTQYHKEIYKNQGILNNVLPDIKTNKVVSLVIS